MIEFNPTQKGSMMACLFPETLEERNGIVHQLKGMGFVKAGKYGDNTRMTATINGKLHIALIESLV